MLENSFYIIHTPGAFGNFLAYIFDCYQQKKVLPSPFVSGGASHNREKSTESFDMVLPDRVKFFEQNCYGKKVIGCVWDEEYFNYILHAYLSRTNGGQYGDCGVKFLENNFYDWALRHENVESVKENIVNIKNFFKYNIEETNKVVPRYILRQYFWFQIFYKDNHKVTKVNNKIKSMLDIDLINITDILDYKKLQSFLKKYFNFVLNFKEIHKQFIDLNVSLRDYLKYKNIIEACKNNQPISIEDLSVVGEASVFYDLEKHYFDIPFFTSKEFPKNTVEILDYVKYFPDIMKQPNKLYHQHFRRFPPNVVL